MDIQLTISINFISFENTNEERTMHLKSDNIDVVTYGDGNEVIEETFGSFHLRCQIGLETAIRSKDFIFDFVDLMYRKCHKINFKGSLHIMILESD